MYNWNKLPWAYVDKKISTWVYYKVENDIDNLDNLVKLDKINDFWEWKSELDEQKIEKMNQYRLYLTPNNGILIIHEVQIQKHIFIDM